MAYCTVFPIVITASASSIIFGVNRPTCPLTPIFITFNPCSFFKISSASNTSCGGWLLTKSIFFNCSFLESFSQINLDGAAL